MQIGITTEFGALARPAASSALQVATTIIVVDDDELVTKTLAADLDDAGFRPVTFVNGAEALQYLESGGPAAALLLDWSMPGMDGAEVLRRLRAAGHQVPVLFLTGHAHPIFEEAALAGGAVDFVDKSRSFAVVLQRLRLALAGAKRHATPPAVANGAGALRVDAECARVYWRGERVDLTLSEVKIVKMLTAKPGQDFSYRSLYDLLRGEGFQAGAGEQGYRANVRAMVKRIRQSFRAVDPEFDLIKNYPGFGYRWSADGG